MRLAGSVRDNLLWAAPEATDEALESALEDAAARFVSLCPTGSTRWSVTVGVLCRAVSVSG